MGFGLGEEVDGSCRCSTVDQVHRVVALVDKNKTHAAMIALATMVNTCAWRTLAGVLRSHRLDRTVAQERGRHYHLRPDTALN